MHQHQRLVLVATIVREELHLRMTVTFSSRMLLVEIVDDVVCHPVGR